MPTPAFSALSKDPTKVITVMFGGRSFRCSQRTYGALLEAQEALSKQHPGAFIIVMQGSYNTTVALSAGTHDKDATVDVKTVGISWREAQEFWRKRGWAAWWRHTGSWASPSLWHVHGTLLGAEQAGCEVGSLIPGQIDDYFNHRSGLVGHEPDPTWHPADIAATVFSYARWFTTQEENMPLSDKDIAKVANATAEKIAPVIVNALLNAELGPDGDRVNVRGALYRASNVPDLVRRVRDAVVEAINPTSKK